MDNKIGYSFASSEQALKTPRRQRAWSPALAQAGYEKRYWKARISKGLSGGNGTISQQPPATVNIVDDQTTEISILEQRYDEASLRFALSRNTSVYK